MLTVYPADSLWQERTDYYSKVMIVFNGENFPMWLGATWIQRGQWKEDKAGWLEIHKFLRQAETKFGIKLPFSTTEFLSMVLRGLV